MIISHKYKFIYLRSQKTASTTLDVFFSAYCDMNDIVTVMPEETPEWHNATTGGPINNNHVPAIHVKNWIGDEIWDEYYKVTSIRNPLDKLISSYFWWKEFPNLGPQIARPVDYDSFSKWILDYNFEHKLAIFHEPYYKIDGEIIVNGFIRFESLVKDLVWFCQKMRIEFNPEYLLHYKKTDRKDVEVTDIAKDKIRYLFAQELIDLNYEI